MAGVPNGPEGQPREFRKIADAFLGRGGPPFADLISAERISEVLSKHGNLFGSRGVYSTAIMLWSFLGQVLRDGKEASCQSAVARVVTYCTQIGKCPPTSDTGDYCKAKEKLSHEAIRDLSCQIANDMQQAAEPKWNWNDAPFS